MYDSGSGWPSFTQPVNASSVALVKDDNCTWCGRRTAIECANCGIHLVSVMVTTANFQGHVFDDGIPPTNKRYSINSVCMNFQSAIAEVPVDNLALLRHWWRDMGISIGWLCLRLTYPFRSWIFNNFCNSRLLSSQVLASR